MIRRASDIGRKSECNVVMETTTERYFEKTEIGHLFCM